MADIGGVASTFQKRGLVVVSKQGVEEDKLMETALDLGADDVQDQGEIFEVQCAPGDVEKVSEGLKKAGINVESAEAAMVPKNTVRLEAAMPR